MTKTPAHQAAIAGGLAHFAGLPRIDLDGDRAVVTSYLQILTPHPTAEPHEVPNHGVSNGFRIHRVAANRWELERTAGGWKIRRRTVRTIDGTEPPREILRGALRSFEAAARIHSGGGMCDERIGVRLLPARACAASCRARRASSGT